MAEVVQIDIPGIGLVDARNAASEKTLQDILKALQKGGGVGGSGGGGGGRNDPAPDPQGGLPGEKNPGTMRKSLTAMTEKIKSVVATFVVFGDESTRAVSNLANLGDSLESVANLFSSFPLIGPMFGAVASASERVVGAFNDVSQSGATFGGSLNSFASSASQAGMTLTEFGSLIRSNGQGMLAFGSTVEAGAKRFVQVSKQLRATGSDLYALGLSTQEINKGLATFGEMQRLQGMQGRKSNAELVAGASRYLKNLDALAKITGEEKAAKEAEMKRLLQSAQFQASMAGLSEEVRESFMMTVGQLPQGMQKFAEDIMATGTATTEENQKLLAMMPHSAALLTEFNAKQQRGEAITLEERNRLNNLMKREGGAALQSIKQAGAANAELAPLVNSLASTYQINEDAVKEATEEQKAAKAATDKVNEAVNKMRERIAAVSNTFQMFLVNSGALDSMMSLFEGLVNVITKFVLPIFNVMVGVVNSVVSVISTLASMVLPVLTQAFEQISGMVVGVSSTLQNYLKPALMTVAGFLIADVLPVFEALQNGLTFIADIISTHVWPAMQVLGQAISDHVLPAFEMIGTFIANNLQPILLGLGVSFIAYKVGVMAMTAASWIAGGGIAILAKAAWAAAIPLLKFAAPVLAIVGLFTYLYKTGWSFGTAIEAVKDNLQRFWLTLTDAVNGLLSIIPNALGGISKEEAARRKEANDNIRKDLDQRMQDRDKERAEVAKGRTDTAKAEARQNAVKDVSFKLDQKRLGQQQDQIRAAEKEQELSLGDPYALLKGLAEKEGSEFHVGQKRDQFNTEKADAEKALAEAKTTAEKKAALDKIIAAEKKIADLEKALQERKRSRAATPSTPGPGGTAAGAEPASPGPGGTAAGAEGTRRTIETEAEQRRAQEQRAREEQQRQQQQQQQQQQPTTPPATAPSTQEVLIASIDRLNTNMERMVAQQSRSNTLLTNQVRATENVAGAVSGDLFGMGA